MSHPRFTVAKLWAHRRRISSCSISSCGDTNTQSTTISWTKKKQNKALCTAIARKGRRCGQIVSKNKRVWLRRTARKNKITKSAKAVIRLTYTIVVCAGMKNGETVKNKTRNHIRQFVRQMWDNLHHAHYSVKSKAKELNTVSTREFSISGYNQFDLT